MPKYPRGMVKRRGQYFHRERRGGRDKLFPLGSDFDEAKRRFHRLKGLGLSIDRRVTVAEFGARWLEEYVVRRRTEQNQKLAGQRMRDHILPVLGRKLMVEVTPADIRCLSVVLEPKGLALRTVKHVLSDVRCMFNYAAGEVGIIERTPFRGKLMPEVQDKVPDPFSEDEVGRILEVVPRQHLELVQCALLTAMRYGELRGLLWSDVCLGNRAHVIVQRSHRGPTKTRKVRYVPLTEEAEALMKGLPKRSVFVFPGRFGGMMARDASGIIRAVRPFVPGFLFRRLRDTSASRFLEAGGSIEFLRIILGHSTVRMTEGYGRISDKRVWEEMRSLRLNLPKTVNETGNSASETLAEAGGNR